MKALLKRIIAFCIDLVLLNLVGRLLSLLFSPYFVALDHFGFIIGVVVFVGYFATFEGALKIPASPGKRVLGLRVYTGNGTKIGIGRSAYRSLLVIFPITFIIYIHFWEFMHQTWMSFGICLIFESLVLLQVLSGFINNGNTLQDLLTKTTVATFDGNQNSPLRSNFILKNFAVFTVGLSLLTAWTGYHVGDLRRGCEKYDLDKLSVSSKENGVVSMEPSCIKMANIEKHDHPMLAFYGRALIPSAVNKETALKVAKEINRNGFRLQPPDELRVDLNYGFDIGIYSYQQSTSVNFQAAEFNSLEKSL